MMSEFPPSLSLSRDVTFYLDTIRPFRWAASIIPCKEGKVNILGKVLMLGGNCEIRKEEDYCLTSSIFISAKASSTSEAENFTPKVMRECLRTFS